MKEYNNLNLKNPEVIKLARKLAKDEGTSITQAIFNALIQKKNMLREKAHKPKSLSLELKTIMERVKKLKVYDTSSILGDKSFCA